jgi:hypothetical protein
MNENFVESQTEGFARYHGYSNQDTPTQSQLQTWLRKTHNISVFVIDDILYGYEDDYGDSHYYIKNRHEIIRPVNVEMTYEQSLEIGLVEALKLI